MLSNVSSTWCEVGTLHGKTIYRSPEGSLAIERDFEALCELTPDETAEWEARDPVWALIKRQEKLSAERELVEGHGLKWPIRSRARDNQDCKVSPDFDCEGGA